MKRNKIKLSLCTLALAFAGACSTDKEPVEPIIDPVTYPGDEAYVISRGDHYQKVEGILYAIDSYTLEMQEDVFTTANNRYMGDTPQCGLVYGSKIYIAVTNENTIEILDRGTYKSLKQIKLSDLNYGNQPRSMAEKDGKIYISMFDGHLARLDAKTDTFDAVVEVGPNPENICIFNNKVYVPNSDGMNWETGIYGKTASVVDIPSFTLTETLTVPENPNKFMTDGTNLYLLAMGNYNDVPSAVYRLTTNGFEELGQGNLACLHKNCMYVASAPWNGETTYYRYNLLSGEKTELFFDGAKAATAIAVNPANDYIYITANKFEDGQSVYWLPGELHIYDGDCHEIADYDIGIGDAFIFFANEK